MTEIKKILITGASGSVGKNIVEYFSKGNYDVIGVWNRNKPNICSEYVRYLQVDLGERDQVKQLFSDYSFDAIIHLAVQIRSKYIKDYLKNSVALTENLLESAQENGVRTFIYTSSFSIYGDVIDVIDEDSNRVNLDDYGTSKYVCERLIEDSAIENRVVIRLPRMLGKRVDLTHPWVPKLAKELMQNKEIRYFNPELLYNNLAHTDTLGEFFKKIVDNDSSTVWKGFHVMGIGAAEPVRIIDIIQQLKDGLNSTSFLYEVKKVPSRNACFHVDISRAERYGYEPWTVKETLARFIKDLQEGEVL